MKRNFLTAILFALVSAFVSCTRVELTISDFYDTFDLVIKPRWTELEKRPSGMTAYVYPTDGSAPKIVSSNNVDSIEIRLEAGGYRVILMNQSPSEFPSLQFKRMESYYDAQIVAAGCENTQSYSLKPHCRMTEAPELLAIDCCNEIVVHQSDIEEISSDKKRLRKIVTMKPHIVVSTLYINVPVDGIWNAWSASASIDGMSDCVYLTYYDTGQSLAAHTIPTWTPGYQGPSSQYGTLSAQITTLGMPGTSLYIASDASVETQHTSITRSVTDPQFKADDIYLHMKVLLVDLKTVIDTTYAVGDLITREINEPLVLELEPQEYMFLPYVQPADGSGKAGFDVSVEEWNVIHDDVFV